MVAMGSVGDCVQFGAGVVRQAAQVDGSTWNDVPDRCWSGCGCKNGRVDGVGGLERRLLGCQTQTKQASFSPGSVAAKANVRRAGKRVQLTTTPVIRGARIQTTTLFGSWWRRRAAVLGLVLSLECLRSVISLERAPALLLLRVQGNMGERLG